MIALSGEPCEGMWPPEGSTASPPLAPGPSATSRTAAGGVSASATAKAAAMPRTAARVGRVAAIEITRRAVARTAHAMPGSEPQSPRSADRPGMPNAWSAPHPASTSAAVAATTRHTRTAASAVEAASFQASTTHSPVAASDRTASCLPCTSRGGISVACTSAMPVRPMVAAERSVASRRLSAVSVATVRLPLRARVEAMPPLGGHDLPAEHHVVVLVGQVVAVGHVRAGEGPEPARDVRLLARIQGDHVLLGGVVQVAAGGAARQGRPGLAVAVEHRVLLHGEVHRVHPAAAAVLDPPDV